jgi:hypothetical protein
MDLEIRSSLKSHLATFSATVNLVDVRRAQSSRAVPGKARVEHSHVQRMHVVLGGGARGEYGWERNLAEHGGWVSVSVTGGLVARVYSCVVPFKSGIFFLFSLFLFEMFFLGVSRALAFPEFLSKTATSNWLSIRR